MLRPLASLHNFSEETIDNFHKNGYFFVEDIDNSPEIIERFVNVKVMKNFMIPPLTLLALDHWQAELEYQKLSSSSKLLDKILDGGFQCGTITELCGAQGSGKTQICFQACLHVQLSRELGGLNGRALYIDTKNAFSLQRINALKRKIKKEEDKMKKQENKRIREMKKIERERIKEEKLKGKEEKAPCKRKLKEENLKAKENRPVQKKKKKLT